jgi:thiamine biosynthesis lipoprotein
VTPTSRTRIHAFGRSCQLAVDPNRHDAGELLAKAAEELRRIEDKFNSFDGDSVISRINQAAGTGAFIELDAESRSLLDFATTLWSESHHLFDPSTRLLQNCYSEDGRLRASESQLQAMLGLVGWKHLEVNEAGAHLSKKGMVIDLNSIVCAYAADTIRKKLARAGVESAWIDLDQDVATLGRQPDGANWLVGVRHPRGERTAIARLKVNNQGFARRGSFERRIDIDGEPYGRGLSPVDGHPVPGLLSVIVIAESCLTACSAAAIARLKTEEAAKQWLDQLGMPWMAIDRKFRCCGPLAPR